MKYQVTLFNGGFAVDQTEINTSTPKQAATFAINKYMGQAEHARVRGKRVFRFDRKLKPIKGEMRVFKTQVGSTPALLLMVKNYSEFLRFNDRERRDDTYERVSKCITSPSAASVENDPAQTDTTASTEGTNVSGSSMFLKISNGFAGSVILLDLLTLLTIEKSFGKDNAEDTDTGTWFSGLTVSPSNPKPETLWATVRKLPDPDNAPFPGTNEVMVELEGTTIKVTKHGEMYYGSDALWLPEWLDFEHVVAKIVNNKPTGLTYVPEMRRHMGKTVKMRICKSSQADPHYTAFGFCWEKEWLEIGMKGVDAPETVTATVKDIKPGTKTKGVVFVPPMSRYVGETLEFQKHKQKPGIYIAEGWQFAKTWLEFQKRVDVEDLFKEPKRNEKKEDHKFTSLLSDDVVEEIKQFNKQTLMWTKMIYAGAWNRKSVAKWSGS